MIYAIKVLSTNKSLNIYDDSYERRQNLIDSGSVFMHF